MTVSVAILIQAGINVHTSYLRLLPGFMLMGIGIGLVMSPMSTVAMNAVDRTKAGAASGTVSMSRMVGGTFGVAVMGALIATLGRSKIDQALPQLPEAARAKLASSLGAGGISGHHAPPVVVSAVQHAFVSSLGTGLGIGAAVTFCAAILAWVLVEPKAKLVQAALPVSEPNTAGEAAATEVVV